MALGRAPDDPDLPTVLFYTDNGMGLGHLTRQSAIARRATGRFRPYFLTISAGYSLPRALGIPTEYFPSYALLGLTRAEWEPLFADRFVDAIAASNAVAVVVDHVRPPRVFRHLPSRTPDVTYIWSRRGMWQPDKNGDALKLAGCFDVIVEPGDVAAPIDQGLTSGRRDGALAAGPVVLIDPDEYLSRDEARAALGIPPTGRAVLLNIGDVDPDEIGRLTAHARNVISAAAPDPIHLFTPRHPLHADTIPPVDGVATAPVYPVARYFNAFDGVVSTSGYNSFHEIVVSGLPAVFVPHQHARTDDQHRRAEYAALAGRAHFAPTMYDPAFPHGVRRMLRPEEAAISQRTTEQLGEMTGADEIAAIIGEAALERPISAERAPAATPIARSDADTVPDDPLRPSLVLATDHDDDELRELADSLDDDELRRTIVLVRDGDGTPLYLRGIAFESVLDADEWDRLGLTEYDRYLDERVAQITERYGARVVDVAGAS